METREAYSMQCKNRIRNSKLFLIPWVNFVFAWTTRIIVNKALLIFRNGERSGTMNGQEHLGAIESERSNALERIVENGHGTVTFTFLKTKETLY